MTERLPITTEAVQRSIKEISHNAFLYESLIRRGEEETGWFVSSPGIIVDGVYPEYDELTQSDDRYATVTRLKGSQRKLNASTLIAAESIILPVSMDNDGIDAFFEASKRDPSLYRRFGYVGLNEPGFPLLKPIKTEVSGYIDTDLTGIELAAEGLSEYLNNSIGIHTSETSVEEINEDIRKTYARHEIYMEKFSKSIQKSLGLK